MVTKSAANLNQLLSLMTVAFNELSLGMTNGWIAPTLNMLQNPSSELPITMEESSWIASLENFGTIPAAVLAAFALDIIGRKFLLTSISLILFLMWAVKIFTRSVLVLCLMQLLFGICVGINNATNSLYLAEISSPYIRGVFGAVCVTSYYIGIFFEFIVATYCSYTSTTIINTMVTFFALASVLWTKEPVQFLLMKGKYTQAEKNFAWLRGCNIDNENIQMEFERIKQNVLAENLKKSSFKKTITSPANYKSLFIMITLYALVGFTGFYPVMSYASMAFSSSDILTSNEFTILFGLGQALAIVPSALFIGRFNRRTIILISLSLIALSHSVTATFYYVNSNFVAIPYFPWLIFTSITFYASVYAFVYPAIFIIRGELFPLSIKATGGCLSIVAYNMTNFFTTKVFLYISYHWGIEANFLLFCFMTLISTLFVYFFLPETKNKSLIEIQEMLEKTK
ncbi:facilitated trehalose transporter Tret1-like [Planococcus citri]|uniref:facilitated trehalose transporter Tret1-like n=1 Tax=Planococcus citri TaxID=170843 RepID=UPI0031F9DDF2